MSKTTAYQISHVKNFSKDHDFLGPFCRIHTSLLNSELKRRDWVCIVNNANGQKIFRQARGLSVQGFTKQSIEIDYDSRVDLGIDGDRDDNGFIQCDLSVRRASLIESFFTANWKHPDYTHMVSYRLALIGCFLGILGLVLGMLSLGS
jgi:hypothetical protein